MDTIMWIVKFVNSWIALFSLVTKYFMWLMDFWTKLIFLSFPFGELFVYICTRKIIFILANIHYFPFVYFHYMIFSSLFFPFVIIFHLFCYNLIYFFLCKSVYYLHLFMISFYYFYVDLYLLFMICFMIYCLLFLSFSFYYYIY